MKKIYMILCAAMMVAGTMKAEVLLNEHFAQKTEMLASNENVGAGSIATSGWTNISGSGQIYMSSTDLTYSGYKSLTDNTNSVEYKATYGMKSATPLKKAVSSGSVYAAAIIKMNSAAGAATARDYIWALSPKKEAFSNGNNHYLRLCFQQEGNGFKLGIAKQAESAAYISYTGELEFNKTYLVVAEYQWVEGDKNDVVSLYLNPSKGAKPAATLVCKQSATSNQGGEVGSGTRDDASQLTSIMLYSSASTKAAMLIDELKVVTDWADLWEEGGSGGEGGDPEPIIVSEGKISLGNEYGYTYSQRQYTKEVEVLAENLTENISVTHVNEAVALSATSLGKDGGKLTLTLDKPQNAGYGYDTLTFSSSGVKEELYVKWYNVISYSTLAELKAASANDDEYGEYAFTGEAVVTRVIDYATYFTYYLQAENTAVLLSDEWMQAMEYYEVGDKVTGFLVYAGEYSAYTGVRPLIMGGFETILSSGNSVEPQVVTLAALQAAPADYLLEIVKIENATLDQKGEVFKAGSNVAISQGGVNATLQPINSSADYIGLTIPEKADITGFSTNIAGTIIVPRDKNDIVEKGGETGVIQVQRDNVPCTKVLRGGQLYILRGGVQYNILGINQK